MKSLIRDLLIAEVTFLSVDGEGEDNCSFPHSVRACRNGCRRTQSCDPVLTQLRIGGRS